MIIYNFKKINCIFSNINRKDTVMKRLSVIIIAAVFVISLFSLASCSKSSKSEQMKNMQSQQVNTQSPEESIVRKGQIDLNAIDKNHDGKVYQDQMHWNVISDVPGICPLCDMRLQEVTIDKARENLKENGFDVK